MNLTRSPEADVPPPLPARRFDGGGPSCPPLPCGCYLVSDEQLTMLVRQVVDREMNSLRETVREDVIRRVGGSVTQSVSQQVRRRIDGTGLRERIGRLNLNVHGVVHEEVHAELHKLHKGPESHLVLATATHVALGAFTLNAFPWMGEFVTPWFSEVVAGIKTELITAHHFQNVPHAKHYHGSLTLKVLAKLDHKVGLSKWVGSQFKESAGRHRTEAGRVAREGEDLAIKANDVSYAYPEYVESAAELQLKASTYEAVASTFEAKMSSLSAGDGAIKH